MKEQVKKVKEVYRRFVQAEVELERAADGTLTSMTFTASSEAPYERWFGTEILDHSKGAVRMERANSGAMPLLFNHNMNDPLGMIEKMWLADGKSHVKAKPFSTDRFSEVQKMIDGGLRNVSIAYKILKIEENSKTEEYRVTDWEPFEVSIVTVPADPTVGIGREYEVRMLVNEPAEATVAEALTRRAIMPEAETAAAPAGSTTVESNGAGKELTPVQYEERRKKAIRTLCSMNKLDERFAEMFVGQGLSAEDATEEILKVIEERGRNNPQSKAKLGLTEKQVESFSWLRAIAAVVQQNWTNAPFELECSREIAKNLKRVPDPQKFYIPYEVLENQKVGMIPTTPQERMMAQRDLVVATTTAGGFLRETSNMGFIELLRNRSVVMRMGARRLSGLVGNVTIPRQSAAGTLYWLANEASIATESQQTFEQVSLSPNNAAAYTEISRQLLLQSNPGAEQIVVNDLSTICALGVDLAGLAGTGTEQPQGIIGASGVGTFAGPTFNYAAVLAAQVDVAVANVMPVSGGYVTTPAVAALGMQRQRFSSTDTPLWNGNLWDGSMAGFAAMSTNQMPADKMIFGDWTELILAEWGVLEVDVNPYAQFQAGIIGVRVMYSVDFGIKHPAAFSTMDSII
jgi:HK97 family phage major capsid protein